MATRVITSSMVSSLVGTTIEMMFEPTRYFAIYYASTIRYSFKMATLATESYERG